MPWTLFFWWTPLFVPDFEEEYYHFSILHSFNIMHYYIISAWPFLGLSECTIFYVKYLHSKLNMSKQEKQLRITMLQYNVFCYKMFVSSAFIHSLYISRRGSAPPATTGSSPRGSSGSGCRQGEAETRAANEPSRRLKLQNYREGLYSTFSVN